MLKAILVDDEQHCIDRLTKLLGSYTDLISIEVTCDTVPKAKDAIIELQPDVIFLDVQIYEMTGFDLLAQLSDINFEVVFITGFDRYAVNAFRHSALDYLLKPVDADDLDSTVKKLVEKATQKETSKKLETLFHNFESKVNNNRKLAIPSLYGHSFVKVDDIIRCHSQGNYTDIFLVSNRKITATKTLKYFEEILDGSQFFRVHKSHYINMNFVEKYFKGKSSYVEMIDGVSVEIASRRKEEFLKRFKL